MDVQLKLIPLEESLVEPLANYWSSLSEEALELMGVNASKLPTKEQFVSNISSQLTTPIKEKKAYALIAMLNGEPIGHCNLNPIEFGFSAKMHLHIWNKDNRRSGLGFQMVLNALPIFFDTFQLQEIICEPMASNAAPNKTLQRIGFQFIKKYLTTPGSINYEQEVNQWKFNSNALLDS